MPVSDHPTSDRSNFPDFLAGGKLIKTADGVRMRQLVATTTDTTSRTDVYRYRTSYWASYRTGKWWKRRTVWYQVW